MLSRFRIRASGDFRFASSASFVTSLVYKEPVHFYNFEVMVFIWYEDRWALVCLLLSEEFLVFLSLEEALALRAASCAYRPMLRLIGLHLGSGETPAGVFQGNFMVGRAVSLPYYGGNFPTLARLQAFHRVTNHGDEHQRVHRLLWPHRRQ